jgi:transposase
MSYSLDFRIMVLKYIDVNGNISEASRIFGISRTTIGTWLKKQAEHGSPAALKLTRSWKKLDPAVLESYVKEHSDCTLIEYARHFGISSRGVGFILKRLKISRKKRPHCTKKDVKRSVRYFWSK